MQVDAWTSGILIDGQWPYRHGYKHPECFRPIPQVSRERFNVRVVHIYIYIFAGFQDSSNAHCFALPSKDIDNPRDAKTKSCHSVAGRNRTSRPSPPEDGGKGDTDRELVLPQALLNLIDKKFEQQSKFLEEKLANINNNIMQSAPAHSHSSS